MSSILFLSPSLSCFSLVVVVDVVLRSDVYVYVYVHVYVYVSFFFSLYGQPDPDEGIMAHLVGQKTALLIPPLGLSKEDLDELFQYRWKTGSLADLYLNNHDINNNTDNENDDGNGNNIIHDHATKKKKDATTTTTTASAMTTNSILSRVEMYWVDLQPGDLLYIPKSWLHDIESTTETVSLVTRFEILS